MKVRMARRAKVHNRHNEEYRQVVNGELVVIPPGGSITVPRRRALDIRGHYPGKGIICKLEIEPIYEEVDQAESYTDHRTGQVFATKEALLRHLGIDDEAGVPQADRWTCGLCKTDYPTEDALAEHMLSCAGGKRATSGQREKGKKTAGVAAVPA